jgi:hypothetical protein
MVTAHGRFASKDGHPRPCRVAAVGNAITVGVGHHSLETPENQPGCTDTPAGL